jgi:hypothetical protein
MSTSNLPADAALKDALFQKTAALRPRPRPWRAALAATAAAGVVLALVWSYLTFRARQDVVLPNEIPPTPQTAAPGVHPQTPHDADGAQSSALALAQPEDLEWRAFDTDDDRDRARLYFRAGDLYLSAEQDIDAALRCYRQALASCDARELRFDPADNWLVMALKNDRRKEP